jgi:heptosyltransferase-3
MRILVFRGGALGDFLVTLPALGLLRARWPEAHISLIGNAPVAELGVLGGYLDAAHSQHQARWSALYRDEPLPPNLTTWLADFDLVINCWPDPDGTLARRFPLRRGQQFLFTSASPTLAPAARHFCEPLRALGLSTTDYRSRLRTSDETLCHREAGEASRGDPAGLLRRIAPRNDDRPGAPASLRKPDPVAVHPGSGSPRKNWSKERWIELMQRLEQPLLLVLGEAEKDRWSALTSTRLNPGISAQRLGDKSLHLAFKLPFPQLASILARCRLFLGHDSGMSHLAAAVGTPCILLFGPTDPAMWAPPGDDVRVLRRGESLDTISVDEVLGAMFAALSRSNP